jgi:hypothetical protein
MADKSGKYKDDSSVDIPKTLEDRKKKREELSKPKKHGWWYNESTKYLIFQIEEGNSYDIELERLKNPFELVNFIFHLLHKMFVNEKDMYEFLEAIDVLLNPEYDSLFWKNNKDRKE